MNNLGKYLLKMSQTVNSLTRAPKENKKKETKAHRKAGKGYEQFTESSNDFMNEYNINFIACVVIRCGKDA